VAAVLLPALSAVLVVLSQDVAWSALALPGLGVGVLGAGHPRWLVLGGSAATLSVVVCVLMSVAADPAMTQDQLVAWIRAITVVVASTVIAVVVNRRLHRTEQEVTDALAFAHDATVHDTLTGLANRRGLAMLGAQILETARRRGDAVYCMFLDVDGLARVNTELGHQAGDDVLLTVSEALSRSTRATDAVARWGDDEFVVVGPGTGLAPLEMERRVRSRCLENSPLSRDQWAARISAGGAVLEPWDDGNVDTLLRQADREMHLRRALRREAAAPPYRPVRLDPSPRPPDSRRPAGWPD
jgi:diguanylate cyclase (GGDEF)-like protein